MMGERRPFHNVYLKGKDSESKYSPHSKINPHKTISPFILCPTSLNWPGRIGKTQELGERDLESQVARFVNLLHHKLDGVLWSLQQPQWQ